MSDILHYGTKRHSGRYPWGSGKNPQRSKNFTSHYNELKAKGLSDEEIAKGFGTTVKELKQKMALEANEYQKESFDRAVRLKKKGYSDEKISEMTGLSKNEVGLLSETKSFTGEPRQTGRYSKLDPQNPDFNRNLMEEYSKLKDQGMTKAQIAKELGFRSSNALTANVSIATNAIKKENYIEARKLKEQGLSNVAIGERFGVGESTVRNWFKEGFEERRDSSRELADNLKDIVKQKGYIDVGVGTERVLSELYNTKISQDKLGVALEMLKKEGYNTLNVQVDQLGTKEGQKTTINVLSPPGISVKEAYKELNKDYSKIKSVVDYDTGANISTRGLPPVKSISSDRIQIRYAEQGGIDKDGTIEIRRGLEDLNLGTAKYAQVRIGVDDKLYLKGMCVYSDNMPPGVDVIFNTNKKTGTPMDKVLKPMKEDPSNPFGASIKPEESLKRVPRYYIDKDGNKQVSPINVVYEQGDWDKWSKTIASQMLSKQPNELVKRQLKLSYDIRRSELDSILQLENPVVKKKLLESYASDMDSTAVHLKATAFPNQQTRVLLPMPSLKDNEIYAPAYKDGDMVALVRYPHGGRFEIPILKVNNRNKEGRAVLGNEGDAVGINSHNLGMLSGADTDGDSVIVIPTGKSVKIMNDTIHSIGDFDPKQYKIDRSDPKQAKIKHLEGQAKQNEMGRITNLITDMTVQKAPFEEIARAVRHSMVVIDAEKHDLDYRRSEKVENIAELRAKYQIQPDGSVGGAATIFSRAKSKAVVDTRKLVNDKERGIINGIDKETGKVVYETIASDTYPVWEKVNGLKSNEVTRIKSMNSKMKNDPDRVEKISKQLDISSDLVNAAISAKVKEVKHRTVDSTKMMETDDATTLISTAASPNERAYATYANQLKSLANEARKEMVNTVVPKADPEAKKRYSKELASLDYKLNNALLNAPRERQAMAISNQELKIRQEAGMIKDKDELKKVRGQLLTAARAKVGAHKEQIVISEKEWEAIQSRAVSTSKLEQILNNADMDKVKKLATPRKSKGLTTSQIALIKSMAATSKRGGYTQAEIAEKFGISTSTVSDVLNGELG